MEFIVLALVGVVGGLLGGMGMGGGTLLIPLLTLFCKVEQHTAQAVNLISFIPMAIVALIVHAKNKLIDKYKVLWIIIPGVASCIGGCFISKALSGDILSRMFGGFLILLSLFMFIGQLKKKN